MTTTIAPSTEPAVLQSGRTEPQPADDERGDGNPERERFPARLGVAGCATDDGHDDLHAGAGLDVGDSCGDGVRLGG